MGLLTYHFGTGRGPVHRHASPADLDLSGASGDGRPDAVRLDFDGDGRVDDALWDSDGDGAADRSVLDLDDDGRGEHVFCDPSGRGVWDRAAAVAAPLPMLPPDEAGGGPSGTAPGTGPPDAADDGAADDGAADDGAADDGAADDGAADDGAADDGAADDAPDGAGRVLRAQDVRGRELSARAEVDTDGDGRADAGRAEADLRAGSAELVCDLDDDGRAEQLLVDHDRDGVFESAYLSSAGPGSVSARWDVLLADTDADGAVDTPVGEAAEGWMPP